jgi:hypothetical protein
MRTWSIKTVVATLSLTVILAAAAPHAEAKSSQPGRTEVGATQRFQRAVNKLVKRFIGIVSNGLPAEPTPIELTDPETTIATTTPSTPQKER